MAVRGSHSTFLVGPEFFKPSYFTFLVMLNTWLMGYGASLLIIIWGTESEGGLY